MSAVYSVTANESLYTVVDDCTTVYSAVITGAVIDEVLGNFAEPGFQAKVSLGGLKTKTTQFGLYAVTGYPNLSFPKLTSMSYTVDLTLSAPGFRHYLLQVPIPQNATFPVSAQTVALRRLPVRIQGRVVFDATGLPVASAKVVAVDNPNAPPPAAHSLLLRSPLYFNHPVNAPVDLVTLATVGTAQLSQPVAAGAQMLQLTNTTNLTGTAFVQLATPSLTQVEYGVVKGFGAQPGQVLLTSPLNRSYAALGATIVNFVSATPTTTANLLLDSNAGDGILVANQLMTVGTLAVDLGSTSVEYHELGAVTDSNGYYTVDGIGRVQQLFLRANPQTPGTPVVPWVIEFDQPVNQVDFRI